MKIYLITYDLNKVGQDYDKVINSIKDNFPDNKPILKSVFLIKTKLENTEAVSKLLKGMDDSDRYFICEVNNKSSDFYWGRLATNLDVWKWILS